MTLQNKNNEELLSEKRELSFTSKLKGALLLSGNSFSTSYRSSKLWQGYVISIICIGLISFVLSTSTFPVFTGIFPYFIFSLTILGITIWISFSPILLIVSFLSISGLWFFVSLIISHFKNLKLKRTASALGFSFSPLLILIFYLLNKFILQSYKYELGPLLLFISVGWCLLSGFVGLSSLIGVEIWGLFNYSIKSIILRRKRTYAAIIGITVAVGLIVTPIPIISGYYTQLNSLAGQNQYAQYLIGLENGKNNYYSSFIEESILSSINNSNIESICPETYLNVSLLINTMVYQSNLRGINYSIFKDFRTIISFQIVPGETFSEQKILIGSLLASMLNISFTDLPINISLTYNLIIYNVTLIGFITSNVQYDTEFIAPLSLTRILNPALIGKFSIIEVKLKDPKLVDSTIQTLQSENPDLKINRENQLSDFVSGIISRTILSIWLLSIVIYVAMAFGMYHIIQTIIKESEREIAILKSIGSTRFQIVRIFLYQTIILCSIGSILGVLSAIFLSYIASAIVSNITTITVQPIFDILITGIAVLLSLTSGILGSLYPAYKASRMAVGDIIR